MSQPQRKKRFQRDSSVALRLTDRDFDIIKEVYKYRFLTSEQIISLTGASKQGILRRLQRLYHAGYLDRPRAQLARLGNHPIVYGLGNEGAHLLAVEYGFNLPSVDWTTKNREAKGLFLDHTLLVAQFLIVLRLACSESQTIEFIEADEIADRRRQSSPLPEKPLAWRLEVSREFAGVKRNFSYSLVPDAAFGLHFSGGPAPESAYFFVEVDRSTMPLQRRNFSRSSFLKKMIGYWESWRQQLFSQNFHFKAARILTLTMSPERADNMIALNKELDPKGEGLRMFHFAPHYRFTLERPQEVFKPVWQDGRGQTASLVD